jgi:hypothetical protein
MARLSGAIGIEELSTAQVGKAKFAALAIGAVATAARRAAFGKFRDTSVAARAALRENVTGCFS